MGRRRCNLGGSCTVRFVPANYQHLEQVGLLAKAGTTRQTYTTRPRRHSRAALSRSRRPVASACPVLPVSFAFATIVKHWAPHALHGRHPAAVPLPFVTSRTAAAPSKHSLKLLPSLPARHRACWAEYRHHRRPPRDSTPSPPRELREPPHDALDAADALALVRPLPRPPARPWTSPTCASPVRPHAAASSTTANSTQSLPQMVSTSAMSSVRRRPPPSAQLRHSAHMSCRLPGSLCGRHHQRRADADHERHQEDAEPLLEREFRHVRPLHAYVRASWRQQR
jgi:hypothetical protein